MGRKDLYLLDSFIQRMFCRVITIFPTLALVSVSILSNDIFFTEVTSNLAAAAGNNNHSAKTSNVGLSLSNQTAAVVSSSLNNAAANPVPSAFNEEMRFHGTELVMLYDYKVKKNSSAVNFARKAGFL